MTEEFIKKIKDNIKLFLSDSIVLNVYVNEEYKSNFEDMKDILYLSEISCLGDDIEKDDIFCLEFILQEIGTRKITDKDAKKDLDNHIKNKIQQINILKFIKELSENENVILETGEISPGDDIDKLFTLKYKK